MDTYPCPACGGPANAQDGCRRCGRPHDPDAAALALFQRTVASLEQKKRDLTTESVQLRGQLAHASAQRDNLRRKVRQRLDREEQAAKVPRRTMRRRPGQPDSAQFSPMAEGLPERPAERPTDSPRPVRQAAPPPRGNTLTEERPRRAAPPPRSPSGPRPPLPPRPFLRTGAGRGPRRGTLEGPEATTRTMQAAVLSLGGVLLAAAAIVLATSAFGNIGTAARLAVLTVITLAALMFPVYLARKGLTSTAETLAAVALLLVLLDGYVIRSERLFGSDALPWTVYFGVVCLVTASVAAAYSVQSHLIAPRYATVLALQPVMPLLAYPILRGPTGWALVLSAVALVDLGLGVAIGRFRPPSIVELPGQPTTLDADMTGTVVTGRLANEVMRDLAWVFFTVAFGASAAYAVTALTTTRTPAETLRAAMVVLLAASIGVAGSLSWRRGPIPDIASGIATLALIAAFARVGATANPGRPLLFAALAVFIAVAGIRLLPSDARLGPRYAASVILALVGVALVVRTGALIAAPVRAAWPVWHADLGKYTGAIATAAGPYSWQFAIAVLLLAAAGVLIVAPSAREDVLVLGFSFAALVAPAALGSSWLVTPALTVVVAIVAGVLALRMRRARTAWLCLGAAALLGCYAAATSLATPDATALTLTAIALSGAAIALVPRAARTDPESELIAQRVTDAAAGGALFALPGAVAAGTAILFTGVAQGATVVLVMSFLALAVTLGFTAIIQVARGEQSPPMLVGATAGTAAVMIATLVAKGAQTIDVVIAALMVVGAVMLWMAPRLDQREMWQGRFTGSDTAAAAVTVAAIGAFARAVSLASPGIELVTLAVLVFAVAVAARALPWSWRRGPVAGGAIVGAATASYTAVLAIVGAVGIIRVANPPWHAPLGRPWLTSVLSFVDFGWQVPIALLLLAGAAAISLPQPYGDNAASAAAALAAMAAPIGLRLDWRSPMVLGWLAATGIAVWAVFSHTPRAAYTRLVAAGAVGAFAAAASLVRPGATAGTLVALAASAALVAALGAFVHDRYEDRGYLLGAGGVALSGALIAGAGAAAAAAAGLHPNANAAFILTATLAASAAGLAAASLASLKVPGYFGYTSVGVAVGATVTAAVALPTQRGTAVVYAAVAALLGVLAELVRAGHGQDESDWEPARAFVPGRTAVPVRGWRRVSGANNIAAGMGLAAGIPAAIVVVLVAPTMVAALFAPYTWLQKPWTGTPATAVDLGAFSHYVGNGTHVVAAALLTLAAALAAVGLGGSRDAVVNRSVAIIVPGIALTVLIAPAALRAPWPVPPTAALLVATLAGLGLALTLPPVDSEEAGGLRAARRLVFVIAVLAVGAGGAGSLATRSQTLTWLSGSVVVGAVAGLFGRTELARSLGWQVMASTGLGLAFAAGLAAGLPLSKDAFLILIAAAVLLLVAAMLPRLRRGRQVTDRETLVLEVAAYLGGLAAVVLTLGTPAFTAAVLTAFGAMLGLSASGLARNSTHRLYLIIAASVSETVAIWLLLSTVHVALIEAYTLPFALLALIVGLAEFRRRPDLGSWGAYGPALVAGFAPTLALVLAGDTTIVRRVLLIVGAVITVAIGAVRRQKAPVFVGMGVTVIAAVHELLVLGLPWPVLLVLFIGTGVLLVFLGATYEQRRRLERLRVTYRGMR